MALAATLTDWLWSSAHNALGEKRTRSGLAGKYTQQTPMSTNKIHQNTTDDSH